MIFGASITILSIKNLLYAYFMTLFVYTVKWHIGNVFNRSATLRRTTLVFKNPRHGAPGPIGTSKSKSVNIKIESLFFNLHDVMKTVGGVRSSSSHHEG